MVIKSKKGAELTLNIIIIAAIALIVLVVMLFIFSGKIKLFGQGTESCASKGGACSPTGFTAECIKSGSCVCPDVPENQVYIQGTECEKLSRICCKKVY